MTLVAGPEIGGKYVQLLKDAVPRISHVALLVRPENSAHALVSKEIEFAARSSKLQLRPVGARTPDELDAAFSAMARPRADALIVLADPIIYLHRERLADLAVKNRLPAMYGLTEHAEAGRAHGLLGGLRGSSPARSLPCGQDRQGAKPGDLPVERPTRFELIINVKTAKAVSLTLPPLLLSWADWLIE